ncbi:MAG TPA: N-acetyltransferase [Campylobacterales bacterium]|nr:N-acetyltransferase [Campylobacterales bacterium]
MIELVKPTLGDIPKMQELVKSEVENGVILFRDEDDMANTIRSYMLAKDDGELVGFAALHIYSPKLAEIRSLVIKDSYRGKGLGKALLGALESEGKKLGVSQILTLTYQKEFFEKSGFIEIPKENIPEHKIWADCIKCKHFPICNEISLIKTI